VELDFSTRHQHVNFLHALPCIMQSHHSLLV